MRKIFVLLGSFVLVSATISAQTSVSRIFIKGGNEAWANYMQEVYLNPSFQSGIVEYKNGRKYKSNLNYNKILGTVQFIDEKGDTLALNNDDNSVRTVTIGEALFYMQPVCIQKIAGNEKAMLGKNERTRQADKQKVGAMGIPNTAGTIDSYDRTYSRNNHYIDINEELLIRRTTTYYIGSSEGRFAPASKKNIMGMFRGSKREIERFVQERGIDFSKETDLVTLTQYLATL